MNTTAAETCTVERARELTRRITVALDAAWELVAEAWRLRVWEPLEYPSWDDYVNVEFGTSRLRLPREERQDVVRSLREMGMSTRAIASATGVDQKTIVNDLKSTEENSSVDTVTGVNGKRYAPTKPRPQPEPPTINAPGAKPVCDTVPKEREHITAQMEKWATTGVTIIDGGLNESEQFIMARLIRRLTDHLADTEGI